jgi:hypothetical protein
MFVTKEKKYPFLQPGIASVINDRKKLNILVFRIRTDLALGSASAMWFRIQKPRNWAKIKTFLTQTKISDFSKKVFF